MASLTLKIEVCAKVDNARLDQIIERGTARLGRLSRKKRKAEWRHIRNQVAECFTVELVDRPEANA